MPSLLPPASRLGVTSCARARAPSQAPVRFPQDHNRIRPDLWVRDPCRFFLSRSQRRRSYPFLLVRVPDLHPFIIACFVTRNPCSSEDSSSNLRRDRQVLQSYVLPQLVNYKHRAVKRSGNDIVSQYIGHMYASFFDIFFGFGLSSFRVACTDRFPRRISSGSLPEASSTHPPAPAL